jgi:hypothetical protein
MGDRCEGVKKIGDLRNALLCRVGRDQHIDEIIDRITWEGVRSDFTHAVRLRVIQNMKGVALGLDLNGCRGHEIAVGPEPAIRFDHIEANPTLERIDDNTVEFSERTIVLAENVFAEQERVAQLAFRQDFDAISAQVPQPLLISLHTLRTQQPWCQGGHSHLQRVTGPSRLYMRSVPITRAQFLHCIRDASDGMPAALENLIRDYARA